MPYLFNGKYAKINYNNESNLIGESNNKIYRCFVGEVKKFYAKKLIVNFDLRKLSEVNKMMAVRELNKTIF